MGDGSEPEELDGALGHLDNGAEYLLTSALLDLEALFLHFGQSQGDQGVEVVEGELLAEAVVGDELLLNAHDGLQLLLLYLVLEQHPQSSYIFLQGGIVDEL